MSDVAVIVPVLARPHRAFPLAVSVRQTSSAEVVFVASPGDVHEIRALADVRRRVSGVRVVVVEWEPGRGDYARKVNRGVIETTAPWLFQGADDLRFHDGWLDAALHEATRTGARVIGTRDGCNVRTENGRTSTHSLVARSYVEEIGTTDEPGKMLHEGYWHNFVDDELIQTARARREFAFARGSFVEHLHPTSRRHDVPLDGTYERALNREWFREDRRLLNRRRVLFLTAAKHAMRQVGGRPARRQHTRR